MDVRKEPLTGYELFAAYSFEITAVENQDNRLSAEIRQRDTLIL